MRSQSTWSSAHFPLKSLSYILPFCSFKCAATDARWKLVLTKVKRKVVCQTRLFHLFFFSYIWWHKRNFQILSRLGKVKNAALSREAPRNKKRAFVLLLPLISVLNIKYVCLGAVRKLLSNFFFPHVSPRYCERSIIKNIFSSCDCQSSLLVLHGMAIVKRFILQDVVISVSVNMKLFCHSTRKVMVIQLKRRWKQQVYETEKKIIPIS